MTAAQEVVITGLGVVSPIGIGRQAFWDSLKAGRSGVRRVQSFDPKFLPVHIGAEIPDFDAKQYVTPRKSLKVMSRDIQLAFAAAQMASAEAGLTAGVVDPERFGVVFGADLILVDPTEVADAFLHCIDENGFHFDRWGQQAMSDMYPLWLLKFLPNMPACHVAIAQDARGPNNTVTLAEVSSLLALAEGFRLIERGLVDVVITGGTAVRLHPMNTIYRVDHFLSHRNDDPAAACRPFDAGRDGMVLGEGSAAFILESRAHALARGAKIQARVLGYSSTYEPRVSGRPKEGTATRAAIVQVLQRSGLKPGDIGHVNAHGLSTIEDDIAEAQAIRDVLGDVPVTAPKSFFGNLGAAAGAMEMAASICAFSAGEIPITLNYDRPDPRCPVHVVHGEPAPLEKPAAILLNQAAMGQSVAVAISAE